jgi:hypothetical protein
VAERRSEHAGLRDLAEQRTAGAHLGAHELRRRVEEPSEGDDVARADRGQRRVEVVMSHVSAPGSTGTVRVVE